MNSIEYQKEKLVPEIQIGRISEVQKNSFVIRYGEKELLAKLSGKFYQKESMFPVVGDYVNFRYNLQGYRQEYEGAADGGKS